MDSLDPLLQQARQKCADGPPSVMHFAEYARLLEQAGQTGPAVQNLLLATYLQAALLAPHDAAAWLQLGLAFHQADRLDHAEAAFRAALVAHPAMEQALNNLGDLPGLRRAVRLSPGNPDYHANLAHALLSQGQFAEGFREWEWRAPSPPRDFKEPRWKGEDLNGGTLLVHAEQGYGDSIQFARYLPLAAERCGKLIVETRAPMAGLLGRVEAVDQVALWGEPLPPFDAQVRLPSLAAWLPMPPWRGPYLTSERKMDLPAGRKIGVIWSVNPRAHDQKRTIPLSLIASLAESRPDIRFYGLERELPQQQSAAITQLGGRIADFDDLAAAIMAMDLVLSVDTAAAHLAAALGRQVWVMLHSDANWRWWGADDTSCAWYPSATLYRQRNSGDWQDVLERVSADLR